MMEHHRDKDSEDSEHHRKSDDIIVELLDIVQRMDTRLENHINEEMEEMKLLVEQQANNFKQFIAESFPKADPKLHRSTHESVIAFLRTLFSK